jgi:radical SAM superfamily enzyme YgiQ (UPF0313 family)
MIQAPPAARDEEGCAMAVRRYPVYLIKPSHYDDDGYVIQWLRSTIPSNSLAAVYGLIRDAADRGVLAPDRQIECVAIDETNTYVDVAKIVRGIQDAGGGLVGLIGVQSNQFPRAMDLARRFRASGITVLLGGFHVSGTLSMLPGLQPEIQAAIDLGVHLVAGEIEGHVDELLRAAASGTLAPLYNFMDELPELQGAAIPFLPLPILKRSIGTQTSLDAGRGCPFKCSFCTIINVQGRKSRRRTVDDVEAIIRENLAQGVTAYFFTDDNFARNKDWEEIFDRLIELRTRDGIAITFTIQVDTMCHKLPGFIEKAARAGATKAFIGLENINPEALLGAQKRQNKISDYRTMMQAWHDAGVLVFAGYIIGFPNDTPESVLRDVQIIQRELPVDFLEFFYLTPLPGSQDHQHLFQQGAWMDPDLNKYDLFHVTTSHSRMSKSEWETAYKLAWETYYTPAHIETLLRRALVSRIPLSRMLMLAVWFAGTVAIEGVHPLEGGYFRRKVRRSRRPDLPMESPFVFYPRYWLETLIKHWRFFTLALRYRLIAATVSRDPAWRQYADAATASDGTGLGQLIHSASGPVA